jgi:peptidoglycan hydrolase-like protein with peptidoglycan-binding domain
MSGVPMGIHRSRRCMAYAAKVGGSGGSEDLILSVPVGAGGALSGPDVVRVQKALNQIPAEYGGASPRLVEDGRVGPKTLGAISAFQKRHFGWADGRVDVLGRTHAKLSSLLPGKIQRMTMARQYLSQAQQCMLAAQAGLLAAGVQLLSGGGLFGTRNLDLADKHFDIRKSPNPAAALNQLGQVFARMLGSSPVRAAFWVGWPSKRNPSAIPTSTLSLGRAAIFARENTPDGCGWTPST